MSEEQWTPSESLDAFRTATAMVLAAQREDPTSVAMLWNDAPAKSALVWALARVPVCLMHAQAASRGEALDLDRLLRDLSARMAVFDNTEPDDKDGGHQW